MKMIIKRCPDGIVDLYYIIAEQLGYDKEKCSYDCTKIDVSESIMDDIRNTYTDEALFSMRWVTYGPKANKNLKGREVDVQDGFIVEED